MVHLVDHLIDCWADLGVFLVASSMFITRPLKSATLIRLSYCREKRGPYPAVSEETTVELDTALELYVHRLPLEMRNTNAFFLLQAHVTKHFSFGHGLQFEFASAFVFFCDIYIAKLWARFVFYEAAHHPRLWAVMR